jgi:hypothetical protein
MIGDSVMPVGASLPTDALLENSQLTVPDVIAFNDRRSKPCRGWPLLAGHGSDRWR